MSGARILTSAESLAFLQEKGRKKKEEIEQKEEKVRKRREAESKRGRIKTREKEKQDRQLLKHKTSVISTRKRKATETSKSGKGKKAVCSGGETGLHGHDISSNECAVCFGVYEDDLDSDTGEPTCEWLQCTAEDCGVWAHSDCLDRSDRS